MSDCFDGSSPMPMRRVWLGVLTLCLLAGCNTSGSVSKPQPGENAADVPKAPAIDDPIARLHAALAEKNPDYARENAGFEPADGSPLRAAEFQAAGLKDLSPLADLSLVFLSLRDNPVTDLRPLSKLPLEELYLEGTSVEDLSALRVLPLRTLWLNKTPVVDLRPLDGMPLTQINLLESRVVDLSPLAGMPLETVWLNDTKVTDLNPLVACPLVSLTLHRTAVSDISLARRWPSLQRLHIGETQITDLRPLEGLRLTRLIVTPKNIEHGWDVIRKMSTLNELDIELRDPPRWTPEEFWKRFDAGELR